MASDDMLKCPLCQGHAQISRADLIGALTDRNLREKIEKYLAEITSPEDTLAEVGINGSGARDFQKEVHSWNPQLPIWRRSPKE
ncbi:MAG: hypothetical protein LAN63_12475 [Acidobacteriia bacterium]|nr:hypothetical protein [Terriglobia bacterium]